MPLGRDVLSKIIHSGLLVEFGKLRREYFVQDELDIYDFIAEYVKKYNALPGEKVVKKVSLDVVPDETHYEYLRDTLVNRYKIRRMVELAPELNALLLQDKADEAVLKLQKFTQEMVVHEGEGKDLFSLKDLGRMVLEHIKEAREMNGMTGIPTPWESLNEATLGFQNGDLYAVLARVKVGKSLFMFLSSLAAAQSGRKVMVISMEMTARQSARRMIAAEAKVSMNAIRSGKISEFALQKVEEHISKLSDNLLFVQGQFRKNIYELGTLIGATRPDIVFIDGGYLIKTVTTAKGESTWEKMTEVAMSLKTMAATMNIPFVVSFQFNRQVKRDDSKTGGFEKIQLADAIGQLASVGIGIYEDEENEQCRVIDIVGGREGEAATFKINWDWDRMDFSEIQERRYYDEPRTQDEGDSEDYCLLH